MNWKALGSCAILGFAVRGDAFVPLLVSSGAQKHWDLVTVPDLIATNVVNPNTRAIRFFLASDGWSSSNTAAELNALRAGFAQWQAVPGTILKFEDAGLAAPGIDVNNDDGTNALFWAKTSTIVNGGFSDISHALGVTFASSYDDGVIAEADIVFNGVEYDWFTDFTDTLNPGQYVESTALHEMGHFIGLNHSPLGAASIFYTGGSGIDSQAGLSTDDLCGVRFIYPQASQIGLRGTLRGQVTRGALAVLGAVVTAEDLAGTMIAGTLSRANGIYELSALPPGNYHVRVTPLDPLSASEALLTGPDISSEFNAAETRFLPTTNITVTLQAGVTNTLNFSVIDHEPPFRITSIRDATTNSGSYSWAPLPIRVRPGQSNITVGVVSSTLPTSNANLTITGDGLTQAAPTFLKNAFGTGLNFMSITLKISSNATPGLRSFVVQQGTNLAYANGFLDLLPTIPDYNFDGLDDNFQRRYFPLFTTSEAAPGADPDGDGFVNSAEYIAGTVPTNAASLLKIDQVVQNAGGANVTCRSVTGKRYQLYTRPVVASGIWQTVGTPVPASGATVHLLDPAGTSGARFYRVEVLP